MTEPRKIFTMKLDGDLQDRLMAVAEASDRSKAYWMRQLLIKHLPELEAEFIKKQGS